MVLLVDLNQMNDYDRVYAYIRRGEFAKDTDRCTKMDPYVEMELTPEKKVTTKADKGGGKTPTWGVHLELPYNGEEQLHFRVRDDDIGRDDDLGAGALLLRELFFLGGPHFNGDIPINMGTEQMGRIFVQVDLLRPGESHPQVKPNETDP